MPNIRAAGHLEPILAVVIGSLAAIIVLFAADALPRIHHAGAHLEPDWGPGHTDWYSYTDAPGVITPWGRTDEVDPISVVFYNNGSLSQTHYHAHYDSVWAVHDSVGNPQYFYDHYPCDIQDGQDADDLFFTSRLHMRYETGAEWDPSWGTYTLATPHEEQVVLDGGNFVCHAVLSEANHPPGGFVLAKWDIGWDWHNWNNGGGLHYLAGSMWWGNTSEFQQCNGKWAGNDGWVDYIRIDGIH